MEPHPENLKPIRTAERAAELGHEAKGHPKLGNRLKVRKWCNHKCFFFDRCPAITTSLASKADEKGRHRCFITTNGPEVKNYFYNLFQNGEEGLIGILMSLHFKLMISAAKNPTSRDLRDAIETTLALKKGVYGDTQNVHHTGEMVYLVDDIPKENTNAKKKAVPDSEPEQ